MTEAPHRQPPPWAGRFSKQVVRRRFVVGDVHGCSRTLRKLVEDAIKPGPDDILYLLGDYIDRGPDSKGVLDYLMELFMGDYDLRPLRGNHEQLLLDAIDDPEAFTIWKGNGGYGTLQEFGVSHPRELPRRYLDFLNIMPLMHLLDDYVLVHAGLDFRKDSPISETSPRDLLWSRDYRVDPAKLGGENPRHRPQPDTIVCDSQFVARMPHQSGQWLFQQGRAGRGGAGGVEPGFPRTDCGGKL